VYKPNKIFHVVCEGKSEYAYIQEFNRILQKKDIDAMLKPHIAGTGHYVEVVKKYKEIYRNHNKDKKVEAFIIWIDNDIYIRDEKSNSKNYSNKPKSIPDFRFNKHNFEDFLVLHLSKTKVQKWHDICYKENHFEIPMKADVYEPLLSNHIFPKYQKNELPFELSETALNNLQIHQKDTLIQFKSDFADFLFELLQGK